MIRKLCLAPGCPRYRLEGSSYCEKHQDLQAEKEKRKQEFLSNLYTHTPSRADTFYTSTKWKKLSRRILQERPICEICGENYADQVHHIIPVADNPELAYDENNLQPICRACHARLTRKERLERIKNR